MLMLQQLLHLPLIHATSAVLVVPILLLEVPALAVQHSRPTTLVRGLFLFDAIACRNGDICSPYLRCEKAESRKSFYDLVLEVDQLPRINQELPAGSYAVVAYTVNTWGTPVNALFNVKWAMLLGICV